MHAQLDPGLASRVDGRQHRYCSAEKSLHYIRGMDPRIVLLEYRIAECDINLLRDRKKALVKHPPVDVGGDRFLW